jgi:hypothetical protein
MMNDYKSKLEKDNLMSQNFTFKHCSAYGINDTHFNVLHETGAVIGYIDESHLVEFIHGDNTNFRPVANWQNTFGPNLKKSLGLQ